MNETSDVHEAAALVKEMHALTAALRETTRNRSGSNATIVVNAGGVGFWVAIVACCCTLVLTLGFEVWAVVEIQRLHNADDVHMAYINNIIGAQKK